MHRISLLTLLVLSAVNAYLIFSRDWDPIDAWLFVGGLCDCVNPHGAPESGFEGQTQGAKSAATRNGQDRQC